MPDGPWTLPDRWRWSTLGEACVRTSKRDPSKTPRKPFTYVDISSVDNASKRIAEPRGLLGAEAPSRARKVIRADDVIVATTRPYLKNVALVPHDLDDAICSTGFCVLRANPQMTDARWLFHVCCSDLVIGQLTAQMRGATYPAVTDDDVLGAMVPFPPVPDQRRIVGKIEALFERIREAKRLQAEAVSQASQLVEAALADAYPPPGSKLPSGWRWAALGEACEVNPRRPRIKRDKASPTSFLPMNSVDGATGTITELLTRPYANVCEGYTYFAEGDVLFAKITPCMQNGKAVIARGLIEGLGFGSTEFHVLRPRQHLLPEWVFHFVRRRSFRKEAERCFRGSAGQQRVPEDFLRTHPFPIPPLSQQRAIVDHLTRVRSLSSSLAAGQRATAAGLDRLEQSIVDMAFRGEL